MILICVPTYETICPETFKSIYGLEVPRHYAHPMFDFVKGYDCARARNIAAKESLEYDFEYLLFVDSDCIIPKQTLQYFLEQPVDICLGVYPRKNTETGQTEIFKLGGRDFVDSNNLNVAELGFLPSRLDIKGGGLGCALICTEVFKHLQYPFFKYVEYDNGSVLSEDNYFCNKASEAGFTIQVDTRVRCSHLVRRFQYE